MVKNITLSADERMIARARQKAALENRSLNQAFREWLEEWTNPADPKQRYAEVMKSLAQFHPVRKLTRDEMNAR